jgi:hypothetical protein
LSRTEVNVRRSEMTIVQPQSQSPILGELERLCGAIGNLEVELQLLSDRLKPVINVRPTAVVSDVKKEFVPGSTVAIELATAKSRITELANRVQTLVSGLEV